MRDMRHSLALWLPLAACAAIVAWVACLDGAGHAAKAASPASIGARNPARDRAARRDEIDDGRAIDALALPDVDARSPAPPPIVLVRCTGIVRDGDGHFAPGIHVDLGTFDRAPRDPDAEAQIRRSAASLGWMHDDARDAARTAPRIRGACTPLARTETATDGSFAAEFSIDAREFSSGSVEVYAEVEEAGYQRTRSASRIDANVRSARLDLVLVHGGTLCGEVVDRDGAAVANARVELYLDDGAPPLLVACEPARNGRFEIVYTQRARCHLQARAPGIGSAESEELDLASDRSIPPITLALCDRDWLAGTVRHPDGSAPARVELWAFPANKLYEGSDELLKWRMSPAASAPAGERAAFCVSDSDGRFRFDHLARGRYFVVPADELPLDPMLRTFCVCNTGAERIQLVR